MTHARKLEVVGQFSDAEFVQCYRFAASSLCHCNSQLQVRKHAVHIRLAGFHGAIQTDPEEVFETCWANLKDIQRDATEYPELYTQWLLDEMQRMDWLQGMPFITNAATTPL